MWNGRHVTFVAHPELHPQPRSRALFRPDDGIPSTSTTWRQHLLAYNRRGSNPEGLLQAALLYSPPIYKALLNATGAEAFYILSAGWGLIRSGFLVPDYDITFSSQAKPWKRRRTPDRFDDFAQLFEADVRAGETIYFFGGREYLHLYYQLTRALPARKVVYYASKAIVNEPGYQYIRYGPSGTNWHYRCASDFLHGRIEK